MIFIGWNPFGRAKILFSVSVLFEYGGKIKPYYALSNKGPVPKGYNPYKNDKMLIYVRLIADV